MADANDIFNYAKDEDVAKYVTWDNHKSINDTTQFIKATQQRYEKDEAGEWGIELKETGLIIGSIGFVQLDSQNSCASIGYALSKNYWNQGIMTEALRRLFDFAFKEMRLNRIEAFHIPDNQASGQVMQKAGMTYEGLARQKIFAKGTFWEVKQYAVIKEDWLKKEELLKQIVG